MSQSTHPLHTSFTWWYSKKMDKAHPSEADYEKCLRQITTVKTVCYKVAQIIRIYVKLFAGGRFLEFLQLLSTTERYDEWKPS